MIIRIYYIVGDTAKNLFLDLEPGLTICITSTGKIIKSTGLITRVPKIQLLENIE